MKILFLDDDRERKNTFATLVPTFKWVETAQDCIWQLKHQNWNYIFLDHDLGGQVFVNSVEKNCGMEVVRWLESHKVKVNQIFVHTLNPPAGDEMLSRLQNAGYTCQRIPFLMLPRDLYEQLEKRLKNSD